MLVGRTRRSKWDSFNRYRCPPFAFSSIFSLRFLIQNNEALSKEKTSLLLSLPYRNSVVCSFAFSISNVFTWVMYTSASSLLLHLISSTRYNNISFLCFNDIIRLSCSISVNFAHTMDENSFPNPATGLAASHATDQLKRKDEPDTTLLSPPDTVRVEKQA